MAYGLRIRDRDTNAITLEITDRITRIIADTETGTNDGAFFVGGHGGTPFFMAQEPYMSAEGRPPPNIWIDGDYVRWSFASPPNYRRSVRLMVGVY